MFVVKAEMSERFGFSSQAGTALTSRTIMVKELQSLCEQLPADTTQAAYRQAIVDDNVLNKPTLATRKETFSRLRQLYGLDPRLTFFRVLRELWPNAEAQPLIAGFCALTRDRLLRATSSVILERGPGEIVTYPMLAQSIETAFPGHYNATTSRAIGQHALSSWQQTGHLTTTKEKRRVLVRSSPITLTYALLLGYLEDRRGGMLFTTIWTQLLDTTASVRYEQAQAASRQGWLTFRQVGDVVDIDFRLLLTDAERARI